MEKDTSDISEKLNAYRNFCATHKVPDFLPADGVCWSCNKQIFDAFTLQQSRACLTGCPFCGKSYVD